MRRRGREIREAARAIRKANSFLLACHVRPDADALGSLLGLYLGLQQLGKQVRAVSPDGVPELYRFLPRWEEVRDTAGEPAEVAIGLDADGSDRLGSAEQAVLAAPVVVDLDHHSGPDQFGTIRVVDPRAAATGELVFALLQELRVELTPEIASCLLAAILTDTGGFRFANVTPETLRIAAALVEAGAHPAPIYETVYGRRSYRGAQLLGRMLSRLGRTPDGRIAWASLALTDLEEFRAGPDDTEGFVDQVRMVEGVEAALFFREEEPGMVRVSLRSRGGVDVARAAEEFGGGGHRPAAGCTLAEPLETAVESVVEAVRRRLDGEG